MTQKLTFKDKIGYALGDTGGILTFGLVAPFQLMFYTDVLHITSAKASLLILIARIWDTVNDPMWGAFIDSRKPSPKGRFRPYILGASFPLALAAVLMFWRVPGLSQTQYLIWAYITYIFYGMMYTGTNIPYGSLASVITGDDVERSSLSMWRSVGAGLGGLPAQMLLPLLVYSYNEVTGKKDILDADKLLPAVAVLAVLSVIVYVTHYKLTAERVPYTKPVKKYNLLSSLKAIASNPSFLVICLVAMLIMAYQTFTQNNYNYLFKDYYNKPELYALVTVASYLPMGILIPFVGKLVRRFGKREVCAFGLGLSSVFFFLMYFLKGAALMQNPYVFLALIFCGNFGMTFLTMEIWALVMDVIDYHELRTGRQEEGTCYSVVTFVRKLGQTVSGSGAAALLGFIHYDVSNIGNQSAQVVEKLYSVSTLVPALLVLAMFILMAFCYRFSKPKLEQMHADLYAQRKAREEQPEL